MSEENKTTGDHADNDQDDNPSVVTDDAPLDHIAGTETKNTLSDSSEGLSAAEPPLLEDQAGEPVPVAKQNREKRKKSSVARFFLWLFWLILLVALGVGGYYGWQYLKQYLKEEKETASALRASLETQDAEISALQQQLQEQLSTSDKLVQQQMQLSEIGKQWIDQEKRAQQQLADLDRRVASQGSRLRALSTTTRDDWLLAEAEYLLRLANQRLLTERTTENPVALLQTADGILKNLDDPTLFAVRKQIAADITALKVAGHFDREGIYLQLVSLGDVIPQLTLLGNPWQMSAPRAAQAEKSDTATETESGWLNQLWSNAKQALSGMSDYFRIRHRDQPIEPLPDAREELWLRQNLRLMLEQAQLALLREEQAIYQSSLQKAGEWLRRYFERNRQSEVLADQLLSLSEQSVQQDLPDISPSLDALRDYIDLWHLRHEGSKNSSSGENQ